MSKDKINSGHYHEALDRLHIVMENIDDHILKHPVCKKHKKIKKQIEDALETLAEAYQMVGAKSV